MKATNQSDVSGMYQLWLLWFVYHGGLCGWETSTIDLL